MCTCFSVLRRQFPSRSYDSDQLAPPSAEQKTWMQIGLIGHGYDGGNPVVWRPDRSELINAVPGNYDLDVTTQLVAH